MYFCYKWNTSKNLNYYDNLKLGGGGEVKLHYYAMKGNMGGPSKTIFRKSWKKSKTKIKKVHKKLEGGCLWFNIYYYDPDYLWTHFIIHPPPFLQIKVHFLNLSFMEH